MLFHHAFQHREMGDPRRLIFLRPFLIETERREGPVDIRLTQEFLPIGRGIGYRAQQVQCKVQKREHTGMPWSAHRIPLTRRLEARGRRLRNTRRKM